LTALAPYLSTFLLEHLPRERNASPHTSGAYAHSFKLLVRTFGWMTRWRRLVRDYEERIDCSEALIHVALGSLLLRRIAHE